jgi:large subunit ribosomal protein L23
MKNYGKRKVPLISQERQYCVIRAPHITEKATACAEKNCVVFKVALDATKHEVKQAIENVFGVKVLKINTSIEPGKTKRFRQRVGRQSDFKKAYVRLVEGQSIDLNAGMIR